MPATDKELALIRQHPAYLSAERRASKIWDAIWITAQRRARKLREREEARHKAAMEQIQIIEDNGRDRASVASRNVEHRGWEKALADIRARGA